MEGLHKGVVVSELAKFVRARGVNNIVNGIVALARDDNALLFDVMMPDGRIITLPTAEKLTLSLGDVVQIVVPSGNSKQAYIAGLSAVVLGGDPINKILSINQG